MKVLIVLVCLALLFVVVVNSFSYEECPISGGTVTSSNGFIIIHESAIDLSTTASNSLYPSASTYGTILDAATLEMTTVLSNYAATDSSGDVIAYEIMLQYVPFHLELNTDSNQFFFYSGECADSSTTASNSYYSGGCVATLAFSSLISQLSGTWLLHEYGHTYHKGMGSCSQTDAITSAYTNSVANKTAVLTANGDSSDYYAWANEFEYFAELTEAYFAVAPDVTDSSDWPRDRAQLQSQDPVGYAAVDAMWQMSQSDLNACMAACTAQSISSDDEDNGLPTWAIVLIVVVVLVVIGGGVCRYFFYGASILSESVEDKGTELEVKNSVVEA